MNQDKCIHCGADEGLHQAGTNLCPTGGYEAPPHATQTWSTTVYQPTPTKRNMDNAIDAMTEEICGWLRDVQGGIVCPSPATISLRLRRRFTEE